MTQRLRRSAQRGGTSQSAFVRGFIDDPSFSDDSFDDAPSQSAFVRGFIDDDAKAERTWRKVQVSIRVRARLHR